MDMHMKNQDNIVGEESAQLLWCIIDSKPNGVFPDQIRFSLVVLVAIYTAIGWYIWVI
jgi:hypothetical protein